MTARRLTLSPKSDTARHIRRGIPPGRPSSASNFRRGDLIPSRYMSPIRVTPSPWVLHGILFQSDLLIHLDKRIKVLNVVAGGSGDLHYW